MGKAWLSKEFLNWVILSEGGEIVDKRLYERSYQIWEHSNNLIENATDDFQLADGILNLKRCLNHRLQLIEKLYRFQSIDIEGKPKSKATLELLEKYGLARPTVIKTLMYIRNGIEHRDETPPDKKRCEEFVDIVWYFLKSTDSIVNVKRTGADFYLLDSGGNKTQYECSIDINYKNNITFEIYGWFPQGFISEFYEKDYFEVNTKRISNKEKLRNSTGILNIHDDKLDTDLLIEGKIVISKKDIASVIGKIISSY